MVVASVSVGGEKLTRLDPDLPPSILSEALQGTWPTHAWPYALLIASPDAGLTELDTTAPATALHRSQRVARTLAAAAFTAAHCAIVTHPTLAPTFRDMAPHVLCSLLQAEESQDRYDLLLTRHPQPDEAYQPPIPPLNPHTSPLNAPTLWQIYSQGSSLITNSAGENSLDVRDDLREGTDPTALSRPSLERALQIQGLTPQRPGRSPSLCTGIPTYVIAPAAPSTCSVSSLTNPLSRAW